MPDTKPTATDLAARAAFAAVCKRLGGYNHIAEQYKIRPQTARRIWKGTRPVPRSLAREMAATEIAERRYGTGNALLAWAYEGRSLIEIGVKHDGDPIRSLEFPNGSPLDETRAMTEDEISWLAQYAADNGKGSKP